MFMKSNFQDTPKYLETLKSLEAEKIALECYIESFLLGQPLAESYLQKNLTKKNFKRINDGTSFKQISYNNINEYYNLLKRIKNTISVLKNPKEKPIKTPKPTKLNSFWTNVAKKDNVLTIYDSKSKNLIHCGRCAKANKLVFSANKNKKCHYYHAEVRGGGLIALTYKNDVLGNTLAGLYSKYLKKLLNTNYTSVTSSNVLPTEPTGCFLFKGGKTVSKTTDIFIKCSLNKQKDLLSLNLLFDKPKRINGLLFKIIPLKTDSRLKEFITIYSNLDPLIVNQVIPLDYDLKLVN